MAPQVVTERAGDVHINQVNMYDISETNSVQIHQSFTGRTYILDRFMLRVQS